MPEDYFKSSLTAQQIETALTNNQKSVLYSAQLLSDSQKSTARNNIGAYSKPSGGIPKSDLSSAVQASLGKADLAAIPLGGSAGQVLKKNSSSNYDVSWANESAGTINYPSLTNKPSVNGVTLIGNKTTSDLGLYSKPSGGIPKTDLASAVQSSLGKADTAYQKPSTGIPKIDLASDVQTSLDNADTAYQKPSTGIPEIDLASTVQSSLGNADTAYQKPSTGIPKADLASAVQSSLDNADSAYQKPSGGIPKIDFNPNTFIVRREELESAVQTSLGKADNSYQKSSTGIPKTDLASAVQTSLDHADTAYQKVSSSIPKDALSAEVQNSLDNGDAAYQKFSSRIQRSDLDYTTVQTSLNNADAAYQKPSGGIPKSDFESDVQSALIPYGGSPGQVLKKNSSSNYDVSWANESGAGGTSDYEDLTNKPSINGVALIGDKSARSLALYSKPYGGIPKTDLASDVQTSLDNADTAYQKPSTGIPKIDLTSAIQTSLDNADTAYQKPSGGIPKIDLTSAVQTSLDNADTAYQKPSTGIPKIDLASAVQSSLDNADTAYQKPSGGIPKIDLTSAVQSSLIPSGGSAGQVLKKNSSDDYDVFWGTESGGSGGGGGTTDYSDLTNKPSINGVTLTGDKTTTDLKIKPMVLISLENDGDRTYQDTPSGTVTLSTDSPWTGLTIWDVASAFHLSKYIPKLVYGYFTDRYEVYDLVRAETVSDFDTTTTLVFKTISLRNNEVVLKMVTAVGVAGDLVTYATCTYSEIVLGGASSANNSNS